MPQVDHQKLRDMRPGETYAEVCSRVEAASERQRERFAGTAIASNADLHPPQIRKNCALDDGRFALFYAIFGWIDSLFHFIVITQQPQCKTQLILIISKATTKFLTLRSSNIQGGKPNI